MGFKIKKDYQPDDNKKASKQDPDEIQMPGRDRNPSKTSVQPQADNVSKKDKEANSTAQQVNRYEGEGNPSPKVAQDRNAEQELP
jgi:hypothetical protein